MNLQTAQDIAAAIVEAFTEPATLTPPPLVLLDPAEAISAVGAGQSVILVNPPDLEFDTWHSTTAAWSLTVVAGGRDRLTAWAALDALIAGIHGSGLPIDRAEAHDWRPTSDITLPSYRLSFTTDHDNN